MELRSITELLCRTIEDSRKCPSGWEFFESSCYFFSVRFQSWAGAHNACAAFGSHLAVLSIETEQVFLMSKIQGNNSYWLGVTDEQHEGKWAWVTGETPNFGFWDVWEEDPDKEHKDCGAMKPNGRWINERCSKLNRWICEKSWNC
ncbi:PREDICTED: CD209 antigen-like protein C [Corvus brachyrhynchos]|uniref:CD209 antigen-like protein C n=1 Tax=Corvus brachyrhynchos TaxID=85066 RepID=UPI0008167415|nr:PREDICTED: CD209 antigen-like protein C [Corvus brachyrhynchos]